MRRESTSDIDQFGELLGGEGDLPCTGDATEDCGASLMMSVYSINPAD